MLLAAVLISIVIFTIPLLPLFKSLRKDYNPNVINKTSIIVNSNYYVRVEIQLALILFFAPLLVSFTYNSSIKYLIIGVAILLILYTLKNMYDIMQGKYYIVEDKLIKKDLITNNTEDGILYNGNFEFEQYSKIYNKKIKLNYKAYREFMVGESYYIVFAPRLLCVFKKEKNVIEDGSKIVSYERLAQEFKIKKS